jgi:phosphoglycerate dehydrogenase-like enzyme
MKNVALLAKSDCPFVDQIFSRQQRGQISRFANLHPLTLTLDNLTNQSTAAAGSEALLTCWNFPFELLTPEHFPKLRAVFYSGGSVKGFAQPLRLLERGILVVSGRRANSIMVARFCLAQILLACKGYFRNTRDCRDHALTAGGKTFKGTGTYQTKIALLGMGMVARELVKLLQPLDFQILAVDPCLGEAEAARLQVRKVSLETAFGEALVVSNHLPDIPGLSAVLNAPLFRAMPPDATFVNTGRGAQVNEPDLIETARRRPDLSFLLDVTDPEPPAAGNPLYSLPNVQLSSHIAGAMNNELGVLGDSIVSDLRRYCAGQAPLGVEDLSVINS